MAAAAAPFRALEVLDNAGELRRWRMQTAARVFALSVALGLSLTSGAFTETVTLFLALCLIAIVLSLPMPGAYVRYAAPTAEAALAALILVPSHETATPLFVYLVVPPFVAGLQVGFKGALVTAAIEPLVALSGLLASEDVTQVSTAIEPVAPWMLVGLGLGLLGAWMHQIGGRSGRDQDGYESAHRLLGQLREVSRHLSSGLDTSPLAGEMLTRTMEATGGSRALVLVRTTGSTLTPLSAFGPPFTERLEDDPLVDKCWKSGQAQRVDLQSGSTDPQHRIILPLRVESRMIGVIVSDGFEATGAAALKNLRPYLDEHSLRLEAALLFDEVRSTATLEERHRLAREIHDGVAQEIASLGYLVDDLGATTTGEGQQTAQELRRELSRVVSELRLSIFDLRSNVNSNAGLGLVLSDYAREVGRRAGMTVHLALSEQPQRLPVNVETELLRIAQEAITNARKHARANNLWVTLNTQSPVVVMRIEDDGVGSAVIRSDHYGLRIMQERAKRISGDLAITTRPRGGTSVIVSVFPHSSTTPLGAAHDNLDLAR